MSDPIISVVGNNGGYLPIEHKGRTYKLHAWTDKLRARYIRWSHKYVVDQLRKLKDVLTPAEYEKRFDSLTKDIIDGEYGFGKPRLQRLTETEDGVRALITVLLNDDAYTDEELEDFLQHRGEEIVKTLQALHSGTPEDVDPNPRT